MKRISLIAAIIGVCLAPQRARAQADCSTIPPEGQCQGNVLVFCDDNNQAGMVDCSTIPGATCQMINADWGYDCAAAAGAACDSDEATAYCLGTDTACVIAEEASTCQSNITTCDETTDIGTCRDQLLMVYCLGGQPLLLDCTSFGGTCATGACNDLPVDADCDGTELKCAAGLTCSPTDFVCEDGSQPPPPPPPDAGVPTGTHDAGMTPTGTPDSGVRPGNNSQKDAGVSGEVPPNQEDEEQPSIKKTSSGGCSAVTPNGDPVLFVLFTGILIFSVGRRKSRS